MRRAVATFVVLLYPTFNYVHTYGKNDLAARRQVTEQELYGLKISRMVLPDPTHRNPTLAKLGQRAQDKSLVPSEGGQALTILGTLGFLAALWRLITRGWRRLKELAHLEGVSLLDYPLPEVRERMDRQR